MGTSWTVQDMTWKGSTCSAHAFCNQSTSQGLNRGRLACAGYKNLHPHPECLSSWLESIKSSKKQANQPRTALLEVNHSVLQPLLTVDYGNFVPCETHLKLATVGQASSAAHLQWYFPAVPPPTPVGAGSHRNHVAVARHPRAASWSQCPCDAHICGWGEWPGRYLRRCKLDASCMRFHRFSWFMVFQPKWNIIIQPVWLHYFPSFPVKKWHGILNSRHLPPPLSEASDWSMLRIVASPPLKRRWCFLDLESFHIKLGRNTNQ